MNMTEEIKKKIEAERAKDNDPKAKDKIIRAAIIRNPYSKKNFNVTKQIEIATVAPQVADVLKANPDYSLPEMFDLLPEYAQSVVQSTLDHMKADNAKAFGD